MIGRQVTTRIHVSHGFVELRAIAVLARLESWGGDWLAEWRRLAGCDIVTGGLGTLERYASIGLCDHPRRHGDVDELGWWTVPITTLGAVAAVLARSRP